jgi:hypothetical protein
VNGRCAGLGAAGASITIIRSHDVRRLGDASQLDGVHGQRHVRALDILRRSLTAGPKARTRVGRGICSVRSERGRLHSR